MPRKPSYEGWRLCRVGHRYGNHADCPWLLALDLQLNPSCQGEPIQLVEPQPPFCASEG